MELVTHRFSVKTRQQDQVLLMPVGDIQWVGDRSMVALRMLKDHIRWGVDQGAYFIGMGDYIDTFSPSNQERLAAAKLYDTARKGIDKMAKDLVDEIYTEALAPSKGRWLGLLEGHHFHEFRDGTTSDQYLSGLLDTTFLGSSAYVRLVFSRGRQSGSVLVWAHHGEGGGTSVGAVLNKLAPVMRSFEADIYLLGHFTSKDGKPFDRVEPVFPHKHAPRLIYRTKLLVGTGGFMKAYVPGAKQGNIPRGNYVEKRMLLPASLGGPLVKIRPRWKVLEDGTEVWLPDLNVEL